MGDVWSMVPAERLALIDDLGDVDSWLVEEVRDTTLSLLLAVSGRRVVLDLDGPGIEILASAI
ncbi:hypothetical protein [Rhodococcus tibetensis]|uniref:STAS domain-containing protein n=1 Tax=Rhodococcus tibetensis TaxID=2965064 RepID=A0ABT1QBY9_9NOCA|nr:hypothetical protein [Rhodococcus sp. FXJ9.536]MCQ4118615.1 hypothetical protein [Rhodococcus sp. FXJ9.536]